MDIEISVLEEARNIAINAPVFAGDTISHKTADQCAELGWAKRDNSNDWVPTLKNPFFGLMVNGTAFGAASYDEKYELDQTLEERDRAIRDTAKLANAFRDLYNLIGEVAEVEAAYRPVERLVSDYAGLHKFGETNNQEPTP